MTRALGKSSVLLFGHCQASEGSGLNGMNEASPLGAWLLGAMYAMFASTHPWAATGAAFGCCFFLAYPGATTARQRWLLGLFSLGIGYACGVFFYGEGPPYSPKAMLVAATIAALAAVLFTAWSAIIASNGTLPPWLVSIIELWPFKKGSPRDDN